MLKIIDETINNIRTVKIDGGVTGNVTVLGDVVLDDIGGGYFVTKRKLEVYADGKGKWFTVPAGFITDLVTVPKKLQWILPTNDPKWVHAAICHDYLYDPKCPVDANRTTADATLRDIAKSHGASTFFRWAVWLAVRCWPGSKRGFRNKDYPTAIPRNEADTEAIVARPTTA